MTTVEWRSLGAEDIPAVANLIARIESADNAPIRTSMREVESYIGSSHVWRLQGAFAGEVLAAFGLVRVPVDHSKDASVTVSGGVMAEFRALGIGKELLDRQVRTARALAASEGLKSGRIEMHMDSHQVDLANLAADMGFEPFSSYVQMRSDLNAPRDLDKPAAFFEIVPLTQELAREVRRAHNHLFGDPILNPDQSSFTKMRKAQWLDYIAQMEPAWCLVALHTFGDRPRVAGYILGSRFGGQDEGYVEEIAVLPEFRGKHLATGLFGAAIERMGRDGMRYIGLDVEDRVGGEGQLVGLFEHFGFERVSTAYVVAQAL